MDKLRKAWNSFRVLFGRMVKEHHRVCIAAAAGTAVVLAGVGVTMAVQKVQESGVSTVSAEGQERHSQDREDSPDDEEDPARQIPCGYAGVIAVSYTHLDVYKRQILEALKIFSF